MQCLQLKSPSFTFSIDSSRLAPGCIVVVLHFCCVNWIFRNDEWAKDGTPVRVKMSANRHHKYSSHEGRKGQALVFTKFIQDYCRTQVFVSVLCVLVHACVCC